MKVRYRFVNEAVEIDVTDEWGAVLAECDRLEYNNDHKETRRHVSLDMMTQEQGAQFADKFNEDKHHEQIKLMEAMKALSPQQRNLVYRVFIKGETLTSIAQEHGVSPVAIHNRLNRALEKLKLSFR